MKSARKALSKAYKELLSNLTYNDDRVPVYVRIASSKAASPYVVLGSWTPNSNNDKDVFGEKGTVLLDIVCRFDGGDFSIEPTSTIAESITDLVKPTPDAEVLNLEGFASVSTVILSVRELTAPTDTDKMHRTIITVQHTLEEVAN